MEFGFEKFDEIDMFQVQQEVDKKFRLDEAGVHLSWGEAMALHRAPDYIEKAVKERIASCEEEMPDLDSWERLEFLDSIPVSQESLDVGLEFAPELSTIYEDCA